MKTLWTVNLSIRAAVPTWAHHEVQSHLRRRCEIFCNV